RWRSTGRSCGWGSWRAKACSTTRASLPPARASSSTWTSSASPGGWHHDRAHRPGVRRPRLRRGRPCDARRPARAARARRAGAQRWRRGPARAVRRDAGGAGAGRHRHPFSAVGCALEGCGQPRVPAPLRRPAARTWLAPGQRRHHRGLRAAEGGSACAGDARTHRRRPRRRHRRHQRQGHHERAPGLHRPRRRHCRAGGLPARARMSDGPAGLPRAHGAPVLQARIRQAPEDFVVEELDAFEASGAGEHLLLTIEKRALNTAFVARRIAQWAGAPESAVGYAGIKDRHALTRQRFTVQLPGREAPPLELLAFEDAASGESLRVVQAARHSRKLPRGALAGNRFVLVLRGVSGDREAIEARLHAILARGVPNSFGGQRFGHGGGNIGKSLAMFGGRRVRREERSMLLSAARSELFNRVLAARVVADSWDRPLDGEVWMLDGSRSVFGPQPFDDSLAARLAAFDIHPTGPLWG